jgi:hypothetical protein
VRGQSTPRIALPAVPDGQNPPLGDVVRQPRALIKHFRVQVNTYGDDPSATQRILLSDAGPRPQAIQYMTIQDVEYLIGQLQRAIKRAPRAR